MKIFLIVCIILGNLFCEPSMKEIEKEKNEAKIKSPHKTIVFFGDSLTAGMGLDSQEDSFAGIIQNKLKQDGFDYSVINAGLSGDTTSGGLSRINWILSEKPDIFVLELGANDSMRGISPVQVKSNLKKIIQIVKEKYPDCKILLVGMKTFPNLGPIYARKFERIYPEIRNEDQVELVPFLLENVAGKKNLNQPDEIHPTKEGHKIMAKTVYRKLKNML